MYLLITASEYSKGKKGKEKLAKESQKKYSGISAILRYIYLKVCLQYQFKEVVLKPLL